jgi:acyl-coenzyme A synthetase/AMP-(fatty) acid ligase
MYQGYGQTEILSIAMTGARHRFATDVGRSCCVPASFAQLQIWHENKPVSPGATGEIVSKCEGQMLVFWNNPEATAERVIDVWVKTAGIGRLDANGYLYMLDRADGEASVTEKELVELRAGHFGNDKRPARSVARNFASCSGLDEHTESQATDGVRARLRE